MGREVPLKRPRVPAKNPADIPDSQLVADALREPDAYAAIVERYGDAITRYVARITDADPADVDEVAQQALVKAYFHLAGYDPAIKFSSWLYRIAHNAAVDAWRKRERRASVSLDADDTGRLADALAGPQDVAREAGDADRRAAVRAAVAALDPKYREVLVLRFLEDRSYEEIADILRAPLGTVSTLVHRAKESFRQAWSRFYREGA